MPTKDDAGWFYGSAIAAPQNMPKVEVDFTEELGRALKDGFTADEVEKAKKAWLEERTVERAEESSIGGLLMAREQWGRTLEWDAKLEAAVAALTLERVNEAFKRHIDPAAISIAKGGDFKKAVCTSRKGQWGRGDQPRIREPAAKPESWLLTARCLQHFSGMQLLAQVIGAANACRGGARRARNCESVALAAAG